MTQPASRNLWIKLFLPFAAGYFLSYLYRTVNAIIGPVLARELSLPDNALGLLTSTYFLAFGLAQLPLGMLLDRFGPRKVEASLLVLAAAGAAVFGLSDNLTGLAIGRALIGLGVSACLMASFKAFAQWFPPEQQASLTGWIMASGGLGALAASKPLAMALDIASWQQIAFALAATTLLVAVVLFSSVPDKPAGAKVDTLAEQLAGVRAIFADRHFWRYAPMAFAFTGGFMAIQGLWASRWMTVLEGMDSAQIAARLTWLSLSLLAGFLFMGFFATGLQRRGVKMESLYFVSMLVALACFALIALQPQLGSDLSWPLLGICFSLSNLAYSLVAKAFPPSMSGRASTALNLLAFAGAFGLQWGVGGLVDGLQSVGWTIEAAYRAAFTTLLAIQAAAMLWLCIPVRQAAVVRA